MKLYLIFIFCISLSALAAEPEEMLFGHEFEVRDRALERLAIASITSPTLAHQESQEHVLKKIKEIENEVFEEIKKGTKYISKSPFANPSEVSDRFTTFIVRGPKDAYAYQGVWIAFTHDPYVIEVKGQPLTIEKMKEYESALEEQIFGRLKKHGLRPSSFSSAGHITFDWLSAFGKYPQQSLQRGVNFLTDWVNQDFASGTLIFDPHNAEGIRDSAARLKEYKDALSLIQNLLESRKYEKAALAINQLGKKISKGDGSAKNTEIRIDLELKTNEHGELVISNGSRVELRAIRGQSSYREYMLYCKLIQARVKHLREAYKNQWVKLLDRRASIKTANVAGFRKYVEESQLSFIDYELIIRKAFNPCNLLLLPWKAVRRATQ